MDFILKGPVHLNYRMMEEGTIPMLEINVGEGEGMTEVRFVFCDAGQDVRNKR